MLNIYYLDFDPSGSSNGITSYASQYLSGMAGKTEINLSCIWLNSSGTAIIRKTISEGISHYFIPKFKNNQKLNTSERTANLIFDIISERNAIIHINWIGHIEIVKFLKWRINCKIVFTKHCIPWRDLITNDYTKFKQIDKCLNLGVKLSTLDTALVDEISSYKYVDHIITVTKFAKKNLTTLFSYDSKNISVVNNGLDFTKTFKTNNDDKKSLRIKYGFSPNEKLILFVGTISVRKGISDLIEAFNLLLKEPKSENTKLIIAGKGDYSLLFKYTTILSRIVITGNLSKDKLISFYKMADVGIIPSYVEQCSYTAIEMMYAKLPVIASNVDGLKEMIKKDCGTFINLELIAPSGPSFDYIDLKNKILSALNNREEVMQKANMAYKNAISRFSLSTMIEKTMLVYNRVYTDMISKSLQIGAVNSIKVSILLPVHNAQSYIKDCIESILTQTYVNFELIIINDGSTDDTYSLIKNFSDNRIKILDNKTNKGIAKSLNKGLNYCTGDYIARIDADDLMICNRLHEQVHFLEKNKDYSMVGSWYQTINEDGEYLNTSKPLTECQDLKFLLLFSNQFAHSTTMIRTNILKGLKYRDSYKHCEDYDLWFRLSAKNKIGNLPIVLTKYRIHKENISGKHSKQQRENSISLIADKLANLRIDFTTEELKIHAAIMMKLGAQYFTAGSNLLVLINWLDKILSSPTISANYNVKKKGDFKNFIMSTFCLRSFYILILIFKW